VNRRLGRTCDIGQNKLYKLCYLISFDLCTVYLARILFLQGCGNLFWESTSSTRILNELQHSFQVLAKAFVKKLAEGEVYQNWKMEHAPIVIKKRSNWSLWMSCCVMLFLPVFSLDGNLAHNATRCSLSNEPKNFNEIVHFLMFKMCLYFLLSFMHITHLHERTL
jgi:hypothetical protein